MRPETAQLRHDPASHDWTLYWPDRNSCWHRYDDIDPGTVDDLHQAVTKRPQRDMAVMPPSTGMTAPLTNDASGAVSATTM